MPQQKITFLLNFSLNHLFPLNEPVFFYYLIVVENIYKKMLSRLFFTWLITLTKSKGTIISKRLWNIYLKKVIIKNYRCLATYNSIK